MYAMEQYVVRADVVVARALLPWQVPVMTVTMLREVKFS
ncbi:Uncharacterised protein [Mycobacteroides abscessus subsp. abscessus]|nr:Uncharacterised protein [Mycobacteroides abscessus subsp. abscessus]